MTHSLESSYKIWDDINGVAITVESDPDGLGVIYIHTSDKESREHYGEIEVWLQKEEAVMLVKALQKKIKDMEED